VLDPEAERALAEHEPVASGVERRQARGKRLVRRHDGEAVVSLVEGLEDRVGAAGDERGGASFTNQIDRGHDRGEA
jgi:hypothetical protein